VWALEVANVLLVGERRDRIERAQSEQFVGLLSRLPIRTDHTQDAGAMAETMACGRRFGLSAYDAAYLALAIRREAPIATLDRRLIEAAETSGVGRFEP
jgi:predicted nucleic acid-binding protein